MTRLRERRAQPGAESGENASANVPPPAKRTNELPTSTVLLRYDQLPAWLQDNMYILEGYRPPLESYARCFHSLFYLHNETGNVYSHLLGALLFVAFGVLAAGYMEHHRSTILWQDALVMFAFIAGAVGCLGMSATFHLVSCHSHEVSIQWNKCDYLGIVLLTVGSFYPPIYYSFYCYPRYLLLHLTSINVIGAVVAYACVKDHMQSAAYRWTRTMLFIAMGLSGIVPFVHALWLVGVERAWSGFAMVWFLAMGGLYITGALIYAARVPERWFPGRFDYWFHSHQIFHLFVVAAAVSHFIGVIQTFHSHHTSGGMCEG
ncbi:hypothetical protein IWQ60_003334 [Tieghemiomyces parasiticus]|uniref:Uncharacterized protein n=1 Tax=Tieghemiomyces parasiticus TaxID=78921 RepID=A0A9W8AFS8_9FUNG|nr:hypothetical protein IWQ60_003334 [Tieghemiomyces parasiticus]